MLTMGGVKKLETYQIADQACEMSEAVSNIPICEKYTMRS